MPRTNAAFVAEIATMRRVAALFCIAMGSGVSPALADDVPLPRPKPAVSAAPAPWREPLSFREAAGADFQTAAVTSAPSDCRQRLQKVARLRALPRLMGPGACGGEDMVELEAVLLDKGGASGKDLGKAIDIKPAPMLRCEMAEQLALWVRDDIVVRVAKSGMTLASVETYDDFSCRGRNRVFGAKLSEHGKGNAVDIRGITFTDKKSVLLTDKTFARDVRTDLRASACARFTTVLGPGSDGYHEEHVHLDLIQRRGGYRMCQWDVLEPPSPPLPPKPVEVAKADPKADPKADAKPGSKPESKPESKQGPKSDAASEPDDDDADDAADAAAAPRIALADVPLPRPRPPAKRKRARSGIHLPFNLFR